MAFERKNNAKLALLARKPWSVTCFWGTVVCPLLPAKNKSVPFIFIFIGLGASFPSHADAMSTYRYKLEKSADEKVCKHMLAVYNTRFKRPWDTPAIPYTPANKIHYGENSPYAFPKLPGIQHDPWLTYEMRFFRQPTSPEFEAIKWVEGREEIGMSENIPYHSVLWADFDIDNDGKLETVLAAGFFKSWQDSREKAHSGTDHLLIFPQGSVSINPNLTQREVGDLIHGKNPGDNQPRWLSNMFDNHLGIGLRPFIFEGVTYLSSYDQQWRNYPVRLAGPKSETIEILKYRSGGDHAAPGRSLRSNVVIEQICEFRMIPTDKRPK